MDKIEVWAVCFGGFNTDGYTKQLYSILKDSYLSRSTTKSGLLNWNVVVDNENSDHSKISTIDKIATKIHCDIEWLPAEGMRVCWGDQHLNRLCPLHFTQCFGYEKAFYLMGAKFVNSRLKMHVNDRFSRVSSTFHNSRWNTDSPLYARGEVTVRTVGGNRCTKESKNYSICRKSHGCNFLGFLRYGAYRLPRKWQDHRQGVLRFITRQIEGCYSG